MQNDKQKKDGESEMEESIWQRDHLFFKWKLFGETFKHRNKHLSQVNLTRMAMKLFMPGNERTDRVHKNVTRGHLLKELKAFKSAVLDNAL